jgi:hypothetical protein
MAAIKHPLRLTPDVWILWIALTLPIGVAIMAYAASRAQFTSPLKTAVYAGVALSLLMTLGMMGWGWQESIPVRAMALDSLVNLVAMVTASLAGGWIQRG